MFSSWEILNPSPAAEEVEKMNPDLVVRDKVGKPHTVRYEEVNAMLLSEFLKEHKKVEGQQATIAELVATFFAAIRSLFSHARERWLRVVKRGRVGAQ